MFLFVSAYGDFIKSDTKKSERVAEAAYNAAVEAGVSLTSLKQTQEFLLDEWERWS
jgi:hypothetical protein